MATVRPPSLTLLYHYFHPDDVISARLFSDLAVGLRERGWNVTAMPSNRICRDDGSALPRRGEWEGGTIDRVWRPGFKQASGKGRLANSLCMLTGWSWRALTRRRAPREAVIVGTDPVLGVLAAVPWRFFRPRCRIVHWCHDLYPEAAVADGLVREKSLPIRLLKKMLGIAYRRCDVIADLGPCMAGLLAKYGSPAKVETLVPWSLVEPPEPVAIDPATRKELFGEASLGLLYSGSFGRAHMCDGFMALARSLRDAPGVQFNFAARGNRFEELKASATAEDVNIRFAGFAPESQLEKRLGACDIHLVSLRPEWTGTVVPSKFFGALATGRGVLFHGSPESAIARWIEQYQVGWVLNDGNAAQVADSLRKLAADPGGQKAMHRRCHEVYQTHFAKDRMIDRWDVLLRSMVE